jgi:quinol monooxygenase YgiN
MTPQGEVYTAGLWTARPGNEAHFIAAWQEFATWTTQHVPGNLNARLLQDLNEPRRFVSFGPWDSTESVEAWRQLPEFQTFFATAKELCEAIEPHTLRQVAVTG